MKTILCSEYQKSELYRKLLRESGKQGLTEVRLVTMSNLFSIDEEYDREGTALKLAHLLSQERESFPIYRNMFSFSAFIHEVLSFARECALYGITAKDLPKDTESEAELARLLETALSMNLKEHLIHDSRDRLLARTAAEEYLFSSVRAETDPFRHQFLQDLFACSTMRQLPVSPRIPEDTSFRCATSVRQEMESAAQDIILRNRSCGVVLCSYASQLPVLRQVFARYGIPFSTLRSPVSVMVTQVYAALARLALYKTADAMLEALRYRSFSVPCPAGLAGWFQETLTEINVPKISTGILTDFFEKDREAAEAFEEKAAQFFASIHEDLSLLLNAGSAQEALKAAFTVLRASPLLKRSAELEAALVLRNMLSGTLPEVQSEADAEFVLQEIQGLRAEEDSDICSFCQVTDLSHPIDPVDTLYVLGCSGTDYPGTPVRKGIFDEAYTAKISAYPSFESRHALWNDSLSWLFESSGTLIASHAANDYQGREIQPSFEMENRLGKPVPWQTERIRPAGMRKHALNPDTALALYTREDGRIHSSISRIERYFACPYSYFAESGLMVRDSGLAVADSATIGNICHAFFETAVKTHGKQYAEYSEGKTDVFLKPLIEALCAIYPKRKTEMILTGERIQLSLENSIRFLKQFEAASPAFAPVEAEHRFSMEITEHVTLNGIIDRIDESLASIRIIDYKSSEHKLSESKIQAGLQLQLLSYMIIAEVLKQKPSAGVYYMSMKPDTVAMPAGNFKTANKNGVAMTDCRDPETIAALETARRRVCGWATGETTVLPEKYKQLFNPGSGMYDPDLLKECILLLYEEFFRMAALGKIDVSPTAGACVFCKFRSACRFHGQPGKIKSVVMDQVSFRIGKAGD